MSEQHYPIAFATVAAIMLGYAILDYKDDRVANELKKKQQGKGGRG